MAARPKLNIQTPGEEADATAEDTAQPTAAASPEAAASESTEAAPAAKPAPARAAIPDQADVDPDTIPYGKTVLTRQGHVCSTAPDPKRK